MENNELEKENTEGAEGEQNQHATEKTEAEKASSADPPPSLKERFYLRIWEVGIILIATFLLGLWVVERGNQPSEGRLGRTLRVGIVPWPGYVGGLVANNGLRANKDSDFWNHDRKLLVEFVIVPDEAQLRRDFARGGENGGVDVMWSTVDSLAQQAPAFLKEGVRPRAFMQVDWSRGGDAIVATSVIERVEDLKGKKIAVSMAASQWLLEYSLENSSLTDADKKQIRQTRRLTGGSKEARDLFINGSVDAAVLWEPDVSEVLKRKGGAHILLDTKGAGNLIADVMVAKEEFIQQHPDVIAIFTEAWLLEGTTKAISNPMLAVKVLQDEPDFANLGEETTRDLLGKVELATLEDNAEMFGLSGGEIFFDNLFDDAGKLWVEAGYMTTRAAAEQARDIRFLKEIYSAQLGPSAARAGCASERMTKELSVIFPPGKAEITPEAQRTLDDEVSLLPRTMSGVRFCVQAIAAPGDDPRRALETSRARENAVIGYLAEHFSLPRSRFVSVSASPPETAIGGKTTQYILLKLIGAQASDNERGSR